MSPAIHALTMPKWGLTMEQGTVASWNKDVGDHVAEGEEVCDVETEKIAGGMESPAAGTLRRQVASVGDELPIGALLGVIAGEAVSDEEIDAFIEAFEMQEPTEVDGADAGGAPQPEHIEVAGRRVRHLAQPGSGTPVVLVHGFGGNLENWILNHAALAASGRPVAALDLPGHGESAKDVDTGTLEELAAAVLAYMDHMGFAQAHLVGHSIGCAVCTTIASAEPGRVASLALIAPAGAGQPVNREYIDGFIQAVSRRDLKPVLQLLFADPGLVTRQLVDDTLKYKRLEGVGAALSSIAVASLATTQPLAELAEQKPVLVVCGSGDRVIPAPQPDAFAGMDVDCRLLADRGHMVQVEAAEEVNGLILEFIGRQE